MQDIRIILAIAWKDILDGWKNKIIVSSILTSLFLVVFYNYMPELTRGNDPPVLGFFFENETFTVGDLEYSPNFRIFTTTNITTFMDALRDIETPGIGIMLNENIEELQANPSAIELEGYVPYWMKSSQISTLKASVERELASYWDHPVEIRTSGNLVYPTMDSMAFGKGFIAAAGLILGFVIMGLSMAPQLIIEEKENQTLQAVMVSPASLSHFILGKAVAVLFYTTIITIIGLFFVGPLVLHWGIILIAIIIGMMTIIIPGLLVGVLLKNKQQASIWIWVLFIPTMLPLFLSIVRVLPDVLQKIIDWWPMVALFRLVRAGLTYQPSLSSFYREVIYLVGFSLIFLGLTIYAIKKQTLKGT